MVDEPPQAAKESKGIGKHLKKFFKFGLLSTPQCRLNSPQPAASTPGGDISFALISSGVQLTNLSRQGHGISTQLSESPSTSGSSSAYQPRLVPIRRQSGTPTEQETPESVYLSMAKDILGVASSFTQTLLKKAPDVVDTNPVKMAFGIAKIILQIKDDVKDNLDAVERRIASTAAQLLAVQEALATWKPGPSKAEEVQIKLFERTLKEELTKLIQLKKQSLIREVAVYEENKKQIADIFERVNQAREQLVLVTGLRVHKTVHAIQEGLAKSLLKDLKVSEIADHKYHIEGKERRLLHRAVCTRGTRVRILGNITRWANDTSSESQTVYWLFGPAGSGKSTIAYTIARRFEFANDADDMTTLGGNFFCSRLFDETQRVIPIVRTIVYHLALKCKLFADALSHSGRFETIHQNVRAQLEGLLIGPWRECEAARLADPSLPAHYLILIDALDEIDGKGGSEFLRDLLDVINEHRLQGLKFFATSRPDPNLATHLESFENKQFYRLEQVPIEEAQADIATYLKTSLPDFAVRPEMEELVVQAAGLFIYAATVVKYLEDYELPEQEEILTKLRSSSDLAILKTSLDRTPLLDQLYLQILSDAFKDLQPDVRQRRLQILYTFLCTAERTSTSIAVDLLFSSTKTNSTFSYTTIAEKILGRLHAILYTEHNKILWYHKSFPDFLFDRNRSNEFWCNQAEHHRRLTDCCFIVMKKLRFNIANIPSSFSLDSDNSALPGEVEQNIPPVLSYSCRNWDYHLSAAACSDSDPLCGTLSDFLQLRVLFWIEAMNLLGSCGLCDPMLRMANNWVMKYDPALAEDFAEAASFAVYFCGSAASLSTPHLYISGLATWPWNSKLSLGWRSHFPKIPRFTNALVGSRPVLTLRLGSGVNAVACSSDGRRIVSGLDDGSVWVWDASTGKVLNALEGHTGSVSSVAFSGDDRRIVSGSGDQSIWVWDASTGKVLNVLEGHTDSVRSVAFSGDGRRIVSGSDDKSVRVWDALTGKVLNLLEGHTRWVNSVAFSGDGRQIVSGSRDRSIRVWDASTGEVLNVLEGHTDWVGSVAFSNDGRRVASGSDDNSVRVWDASTGKVLNVLEGHTDWVTSVAFSGDGRRIVSGSRDKSVRVWDSSTGEVLNVLEGHTESVISVTFSNDGRRIVSGSGDKLVRVWDASTGEVLNVLEGHTAWVTSVAFSGDDRQIVSGSGDQSIRVCDATGKVLNVLEGHTAWVTSVAFSSDGRRVVSGSGDKLVRVWDASTGEVLNVLEGHIAWVTSVAFSGDGRRIASGSDDKSIRVWDASTGKVLNVLEGHTDSVRSVAFSGDGMWIVSGSRDKSIQVWDASTGEVLNVLEGHTGSVSSVAFSGDGRRIVSGSGDQSIRVWDASTGKVLIMVEGHRDSVTSVAFSSNGRRIVSGSRDRSIRVWDASTGEVLNVLEGHTGSVSSVALSGDDRRVVSGSGDQSIRVWNVSAGEVLNVLEGHTHSVNSLVLSKDGGQIVSQQLGNEPVLLPCYIREKTVDSTGLHTHTGWLISPDGEGYLMFVPLDALLPDSVNILTVPRSRASSVDFTGAKLGLRWHNCYTRSL